MLEQEWSPRDLKTQYRFLLDKLDRTGSPKERRVILEQMDNVRDELASHRRSWKH